MIKVEALAKLLREAEAAHKEYEKAPGVGNFQQMKTEWPEFYAQFMLKHLTRLFP